MKLYNLYTIFLFCLLIENDMLFVLYWVNAKNIPWPKHILQFMFTHIFTICCCVVVVLSQLKIQTIWDANRSKRVINKIRCVWHDSQWALSNYIINIHEFGVTSHASSTITNLFIRIEKIICKSKSQILLAHETSTRQHSLITRLDAQ